jgi:beta-carotene hydroxylase
MHKSPSPRGRMLRYRADWLPVAVVTASFLLHLAIFRWGSTTVAALALLPLFAISTLVAAYNHHHQHVNVFHSRLLNRVYDVVLAVQTGVGPYTWVLHHNLGHHQNYLHQPPCANPDESHWTRADGTQMGRVEYTLHTFLHHQVDVYRVGRKHPAILRRYLLMKVPCYAFMALGFWLNPLNYLLVFFIPSILALMHTCWATYEHHAGHLSSKHEEASVNRENPLFNLVTCNLGLHTAHHMKPGVHWSELPELHRAIRAQIPEHQLLADFW